MDRASCLPAFRADEREMIVNVWALESPATAHASSHEQVDEDAHIEKPGAYSGLIPANFMALARFSASSATSLVQAKSWNPHPPC